MKKLSKVKVASVQYLIEGDLSFPLFLSKIEAYLKKAARESVDLVCLPELVTLDVWPHKKTKSQSAILQNIAGTFESYVENIKQWANDYDMTILAGSTPRLSKGKLFNTALLVSPDGEVFEQDKLMLTPWEIKVGFTTGSSLRTVETALGRLAILTCYDVESPVLSTHLAKQQPEIMVVPSMTESDEGLRRVRQTAQARAIEHHAFVVICPTVGMVNEKWENHGQTVALNPQHPNYPAVTAEGKKNKEEVVVFELDMKKLRESRAKQHYYPALEPLKLRREL